MYPQNTSRKEPGGSSCSPYELILRSFVSVSRGTNRCGDSKWPCAWGLIIGCIGDNCRALVARYVCALFCICKPHYLDRIEPTAPTHKSVSFAPLRETLLMGLESHRDDEKNCTEMLLFSGSK